MTKEGKQAVCFWKTSRRIDFRVLQARLVPTRGDYLRAVNEADLSRRSKTIDTVYCNHLGQIQNSAETSRQSCALRDTNGRPANLTGANSFLRLDADDRRVAY